MYIVYVGDIYTRININVTKKIDLEHLSCERTETLGLKEKSVVVYPTFIFQT